MLSPCRCFRPNDTHPPVHRPPHVLFHFGMTGAFTVKGEKRHKFVKFKIGEEWPPRFTKLELQVPLLSHRGITALV